MTEEETTCTHLPLSNYSLQLHGIINLLSRFMLTLKSFSYLVVGVVRKYTDFLLLIIPTALVLALFSSSIPTSLFIFLNVFCSFVYMATTCSISRVCMHVCMFVCLYVCMCVCMHALQILWMCICIYVCMYALRVCMYVCNFNSKFKHNIQNKINEPAGHPIFTTYYYIYTYNGQS